MILALLTNAAAHAEHRIDAVLLPGYRRLMTLLRASQLQPGNGNRVFRYSRWRAALVALVILSFGLGSLYFGTRQPAGVSRYASYYVGAIVLLGLLTLQRYVTARFRPTNWLARLDASGLYVQFRSYLNYALSDVD